MRPAGQRGEARGAVELAVHDRLAHPADEPNPIAPTVDRRRAFSGDAGGKPAQRRAGEAALKKQFDAKA
jgi:hypothetical protein